MRSPITSSGILLLAFLFFAGGGGVAAQTSHPGGESLTPGDREAIEGLAAGYAERALAGDFDAWADLYHPDAVRMNPGQPPLVGRDAIHSWIHGLVHGVGGSVRSLAVIPQEVEGTRDLAFIRGTYRSELGIQVDGQEVVIHDEGSWLAVVRRDGDDAWRFYRFIANPDVDPAS
jgi:uncharacterized protein (TIGR02246 family)